MCASIAANAQDLHFQGETLQLELLRTKAAGVNIILVFDNNVHHLAK